MDVGDAEATLRLLRERAEREWLRGEPLHATASVGPADGRYKVQGLDRDGHPKRSFTNRLFTGSSDEPGGQTVVRGDRPDCLAVGLYQAARGVDTWLTLTAGRVAVLRLRDRRDRFDEVHAEVTDDADQNRSLGGAIRGVTRLVRSGLGDLADSLRRPPLTERSDDAVLECSFEAPVSAVRLMEEWRPRFMPRLKGGTRWVKVHLADGSSACLTTDEAGLCVLVGPR